MEEFAPVADEFKAVVRYYDMMLKKHQKRLASLDRRGVPEEKREESYRSIRKYEIVLRALKSEGVRAWAVFDADGKLLKQTISEDRMFAWLKYTQTPSEAVKDAHKGYTCRQITITEVRDV